MAANTKVFWTAQERAQLGSEIDKLVHVTGGYSWHSALVKAQASLPPSRRRDIAFWAQVRDRLMPDILKAKSLREASASLAPVEQLPQAPAPSSSSELATLLTAFLVPVLVNALEDPRVVEAFSKLIQPAEPDTKRTGPSYSQRQSPSVTKARVLVAGLLPSQAEEVRKSFSQVLDLRFWNTDESKEHLRALSRNCEIAVGVTNFLSHPADSLLKDLSPKYIRHSGGVKTLKATLQELCVAPA